MRFDVHLHIFRAPNGVQYFASEEVVNANTVGSHFTTGLRFRIFGCKSNRREINTI